eukprot:CAMPEP_0119301210 /NCGR_PEP_ID=MMETSP1333-20130426/3023_1 /TAXON_ID=418940 /ORGANISM="Scyphosphaera apsteinii, Strain RCC1455" /LENGTH=394 /DNA_ID=CAMNT_0007303223 /DNA_START=103 /DNA_END=1287 /DNA_ORIENTATION=-
MLDTVAGFIPQLYDTNTRPEVVAATLRNLGADRLIGSKCVDAVAECSTVEKFLEKAYEKGQEYCPTLCEKGSGLYAKTAPLLAKVKDTDGRRELLTDGKAAAAAKILTPTCELVAPYVQDFAAKKDKVLSDKRVAKALESLKHAKEHPRETAKALRAMAVDLIDYEKQREYRTYIMSDKFQSDTRKLVKEDLPMLAKEAARLGLTTIQIGVNSFAGEIENTRVFLLQKMRSRLHEAHVVDEATMDAQLDRLHTISSRARALIHELKAQADLVIPSSVHSVLTRLSLAFVFSARTSASATEDVTCDGEGDTPPAEGLACEDKITKDGEADTPAAEVLACDDKITKDGEEGNAPAASPFPPSVPHDVKEADTDPKAEVDIADNASRSTVDYTTAEE